MNSIGELRNIKALLVNMMHDSLFYRPKAAFNIPIASNNLFSNKMPTETKRDKKGFTLIELLTVIAIIGILAAIAIPQFSSYKARSGNSIAQADLRNASIAQEAYYFDYQAYAGDVSTLTGSTYGLYLTENVTFNITAASVTNFSMVASHSIGNTSYILEGPGGSPRVFP